jgi:hypothetical protein
VNAIRGLLAPIMCGANGCPVCGPWKARRLADAYHLVQPEVFFTINLVGDNWPAIRDGMTEFRRTFRRRGVSDAEFAYSVEPYTSGGQHHVHGYAWGQVHDHSLFSAAARSSGLADVRVERVYHHANLAYSVKAMADDRLRPRFLAANGGRIVHASRAFWRGPDGSPVRGGFPAVPTAYAAAQRPPAEVACGPIGR